MTNSRLTAPNLLNCESLGSRMMLSSVTIFAAGSTEAETLELIISDEVAFTYNNVGGDIDYFRKAFTSAIVWSQSPVNATARSST